MFEVTIRATTDPVPPGTRYIVAQNGLFLQTEQWWVHAVVPITEMPALQYQEPHITLRLPPIPKLLIDQCYTFMKRIFDAHKTECIVLLYANEEGQWALDVPQQTVSSLRIHTYDAGLRKEGFRLLGTIHSHSSVAASHSSIDEDDEKDFDGIHITLGSFASLNWFTMDSDVVIRGKRCPLPTDMLEPLQVLSVPPTPWYAAQSGKMSRCLGTIVDIPEGWIECVHVKVTAFNPPLIRTKKSAVLVPQDRPKRVSQTSVPCIPLKTDVIPKGDTHEDVR
jgi:PRTRC genetic system protein A